MSEITDEERERILKARAKMESQNLEKELKEFKEFKTETKKSGKFTYVAGILATIFFSCYLIVHAILTIAGWSNGELYRSGELIVANILAWLFQGLIDSPAAIGVMSWIFGVAFVIAIMIFSINLIKNSKKNLKDYVKSTGPMITYICFFFAWLAVPLSMIFDDETKVIPIGIFTIIIVALIITFVILDLIKASNEIDELRAQKPSENIIIVKSEEQPINAEAKLNNIEKELKRLKNLKDQDLISEEEYNTLKKKLF